MDFSARTPITSASFNSSSDPPLHNHDGIEDSVSDDDDDDDDDDGDDVDDDDDDDGDNDSCRMGQLCSVSLQS